MAPSSLASSSLASTTTTPSVDARALLATLLSMLLVVVWGALAVGVVLTVIFPERSISSVAGSTAATTVSSPMSAR